MLLANMLVAEQLLKTCKVTLLRFFFFFVIHGQMYLLLRVLQRTIEFLMHAILLRMWHFFEIILPRTEVK